jgi:hypothetical protein
MIQHECTILDYVLPALLTILWVWKAECLYSISHLQRFYDCRRSCWYWVRQLSTCKQKKISWVFAYPWCQIALQAVAPQKWQLAHASSWLRLRQQLPTLTTGKAYHWAQMLTITRTSRSPPWSFFKVVNYHQQRELSWYAILHCLQKGPHSARVFNMMPPWWSTVSPQHHDVLGS